MTQHTQTPWEVRNNHIKKVGGAVIATTSRVNSLCKHEAEPGSIEDAANAEFIIRACNSHDALVGACSDAAEYLRGNITDSRGKRLLCRTYNDACRIQRKLATKGLTTTLAVKGVKTTLIVTHE